MTIQKNIKIVHYPDLMPYQETWQAMQTFTEQRTPETVDQIWVLQHFPVYTLGLATKPEHILELNQIPIVQTDRGGQITYHGTGQLIFYILMDLSRTHFTVRSLVSTLEESVILYLKQLGIFAQRKDKAPGIYIEGRKIASLGLKIRKNCTYHGLSLNVDLDLTPFEAINPCGYTGLEMTSLKKEGILLNTNEVSQQFLPILLEQLGYSNESF
jgi:lipoyl(octanoyl) transferase